MQQLNQKLHVSMKSGLRDRNNRTTAALHVRSPEVVSMKSGLRDRNNALVTSIYVQMMYNVSMKSGLRDRNNGSPRKAVLTRDFTNVCERSAPQAPATPLC